MNELHYLDSGVFLKEKRGEIKEDGKNSNTQ